MLNESKDDCSHRTAGRPCPISGTPCPGLCVFSDILRDINLGILVLNTEQRNVFFHNRVASELLAGLMPVTDFEGLSSLFLPKKVGGHSAKGGRDARTLHHEGRILGYSSYQITSRYVWIFFSDITEKSRLESIANAMNTMDNIGYIFSGIRHEIGNPVNSVKMTLSVLKENLDVFDKETLREYVDRSLNETLRMEYLLRSLKTFSMFEEPDIREVDLASFLENLLGMACEDFAAQGIEIKVDIAFNARRALVDSRVLHQVMLNILTNSFDALTGRPAPSIDIRTLRKSGLLWISVQDNGCGIPEIQNAVLFKPFHTSKQNGTGLGLVLCRKMLASMNGTIDVKSQEGVGTLVELSVPAGPLEY